MRSARFIAVLFLPEDKVRVKDGDIEGHINRCSIFNKDGYIEYEVRWFQQGTLQTAWFTESQLEDV